jgi:hypothetical protein
MKITKEFLITCFFLFIYFNVSKGNIVDIPVIKKFLFIETFFFQVCLPLIKFLQTKRENIELFYSEMLQDK